MPKTGLNSHRPCGSRKKYKKCGMPPEERESRAVESRTAGQVALLAPKRTEEHLSALLGGLAPYVVAKMVAESEQFAEMKRKDLARAALFWTPDRLAGLETTEILGRLHDLGIDGTRAAYLAVARGRTSAWEISDVWRDNARSGLTRFDDDFLGLAACELWKRYCPERPSIEMLDDWMQDGYQLSEERKADQACDRWLEVWEVIWPRLNPRMRTCDEASVVFSGTQCLFNWVQDFSQELMMAARRATRYGEMGARFCRQILEQFTGEDDLFRDNFRADLGELHFFADQDAEGERVLLDLIAEHPYRGQGYVRLSDILSWSPSEQTPPRDLPRAIQILEEALALPVGDAADYDIELRLADLREELEQGTDSEPGAGPVGEERS